MKKSIKKRIDALKFLILYSKDAGKETKKMCFALIDASENLTKPVYFTGYSEDITYGVHDMLSGNGTTHLGELMKLLDTDFHFSHHDGYFLSAKNFTTGLKLKEKHTHTIWFSNKEYDKNAKEITKNQVNNIKLLDPLYFD